MRFTLVASQEMPPKLRINGLLCKKGYVSKPCGPFGTGGFDLEARVHEYVCYGTRPRATELYDYGHWLQETRPFFFEVERHVLAKWKELLPKEVMLNGRKFIRAFDRYYLGLELNEEQIQFVFDYMAPTYDADIDIGMNLDVNEKLLERIAEVGSVRPGIVRVLDYGVGTGICADTKPQVKGEGDYDWQIVGLDISRLMLKKAKERKHSEDSSSILFEVHEVKNAMLNLKEASFDAAMACFTIHYFLNLRPYENIYRLLKPGGPFVCNVLQNEIFVTENRAKQVGFRSDKERRNLQHEVREQPVIVLTFTKP